MAEAKTTGQVLKEEGLKFAIVGIVGGLLTFLFQYLSWQRDVSYKALERNADSAFQTAKETLMNYEALWDTMSRQATAAGNNDWGNFSAVSLRFPDRLQDWRLNYRQHLSEVETYFDRPRGIARPSSTLADQVDCSRTGFRDTAGADIPKLDSAGATTHLIVLKRCLDRVILRSIGLRARYKEGADGRNIVTDIFKDSVAESCGVQERAIVFRTLLTRVAVGLREGQWHSAILPLEVSAIFPFNLFSTDEKFEAPTPGPTADCEKELRSVPPTSGDAMTPQPGTN